MKAERISAEQPTQLCLRRVDTTYVAIADPKSLITPEQKAQSGLSGVSAAKLTVVGADLVTALAGVLAAHWLRRSGPDGGAATVVFLLSLAFWMSRARLYSARFITRRADEIRRIIDAGFLVVASVALAGFALRFDVSRLWLGLAAVFSTSGLIVEREFVRRLFNARRRAGSMRRRVLIIGENEEADGLIHMFGDDGNLGYEVTENIPAMGVTNGNELTTRVLEAARRTRSTGVVVAASALEGRAANRLIRDLLESGLHVELSSTLIDIAPNRLTVRPLGRYPVVYVEPVQRTGWRAFAKRSFDFVSASAACLLLSPVMAILAILVRKDSPGPVLFKQERVGKDGKVFDVLKFRTMVANAEDLKADLMDRNEGDGPLFKMKNDPRITRVGGFLRKTSLDELPQLWNVVRGEMSLVGPRPALPKEMADWHEDLYGRLRVKPGITGMWQVSGRSGTSFEEYTRLDLYYVDNWNLVVDLAILIKTIPAVLKSDGAY